LLNCSLFGGRGRWEDEQTSKERKKEKNVRGERAGRSGTEMVGCVCAAIAGADKGMTDGGVGHEQGAECAAVVGSMSGRSCSRASQNELAPFPAIQVLSFPTPGHRGDSGRGCLAVADQTGGRGILRQIRVARCMRPWRGRSEGIRRTPEPSAGRCPAG
jgi:hypothetical protein